MRELWVLEQVRTGRISTGKGAELCGLPRAAFMLLMGDHGIPVINYPVEDFEEELREVNRT